MPDKTKKLSIRVKLRLYQMIEELSPLWDGNESAVVNHIFKSFEMSDEHQRLLEKVEKARYFAVWRNFKLREKMKELEKSS